MFTERKANQTFILSEHQLIIKISPQITKLTTLSLKQTTKQHFIISRVWWTLRLRILYIYIYFFKGALCRISTFITLKHNKLQIAVGINNKKQQNKRKIKKRKTFYSNQYGLSNIILGIIRLFWRFSFGPFWRWISYGSSVQGFVSAPKKKKKGECFPESVIIYHHIHLITVCLWDQYSIVNSLLFNYIIYGYFGAFLLVPLVLLASLVSMRYNKKNWLGIGVR